MAPDESSLGELRSEVADLRRELRLLSDRQQIMDCLHRYARGLDRFDRSSLSSAYFPDARDHHGSFHGTPQEFVDWVTGVMEQWDSSLHILDLNNLDINGDEADSECYVLFTQRRSDGEMIDFGGARYLDHLERRDGEWRISDRTVVFDWTGQAEVTSFPDAAAHPTASRDGNDPSYRRPFRADA
jgi:hypothetical protein